jgi:arylsulfatase A-like enzyme
MQLHWCPLLVVALALARGASPAPDEVMRPPAQDPRVARVPQVLGGGEPYSVVLLTIDDVWAGELALYGGPVAMPYLERLADVGVTFTRAYANSVCAATRRSLNYGRWWLRANGDECTAATVDTPPYSEVSLAEALPAHCAAYIGKWHLGRAQGAAWECSALVRGYEFALALAPSNVAGGSSVHCSSRTYREWLEVTAGPNGCSTTVQTAYHPIVVRKAFTQNWRTAPKPAFANINSNLAHAPFHRPSAALLPSGYPATDTAREKFEAMLRAWDTTLGQMLAGIDLATTLVVVVGDNGSPDPVSVPGRAKNTTFERGIRVPLVIAGGPTVNPGRVSDELVHAVDVYATLVDAGGQSPALSPDGVTLMPILHQLPHGPLREYVLCGSKWGSADGDRCAVSRAGFKLRQLDLDGDRIPDVEELYDLASDPDEQVDILASSTEDDALRAWIAAVSP